MLSLNAVSSTYRNINSQFILTTNILILHILSEYRFTQLQTVTPRSENLCLLCFTFTCACTCRCLSHPNIHRSLSSKTTFWQSLLFTAVSMLLESLGLYPFHFLYVFIYILSWTTVYRGFYIAGQTIVSHTSMISVKSTYVLSLFSYFIISLSMFSLVKFQLLFHHSSSEL